MRDSFLQPDLGQRMPEVRMRAVLNGTPGIELFTSPAREAFNGLALAIVRPTRGASGTISVTASADGLQSGTVAVRVTR